MGQEMTVAPQAVGDVAIFDTNRSITGQDGAAYTPVAGPAETPAGRPAGEDFGGQLAERLFAADPAIDHVFVQSNVATVRRSGGWDEAALQQAAGVVGRFFVFYDDQPPAGDPAGEEE